MDASGTKLERLAAEQIELLTRLEAHAARTNELLHLMLNREQRHAFEAASGVRNGGPTLPM